MSNNSNTMHETIDSDLTIKGKKVLPRLTIKGSLVIKKDSCLRVETDLTVGREIYLYFNSTLIVKENVQAKELTMRKYCQTTINGETTLTYLSMSYDCEFNGGTSTTIYKSIDTGFASRVVTKGNIRYGVKKGGILSSLVMFGNCSLIVGGDLEGGQTNVCEACIINVNGNAKATWLNLGNDSKLIVKGNVELLSLDAKQCSVMTLGEAVIRKVKLGHGSILHAKKLVSETLTLGSHSNTSIETSVYTSEELELVSKARLMTESLCTHDSLKINNGSSLDIQGGTLIARSISIQTSVLHSTSNVYIQTYVFMSRGSRVAINGELVSRGVIDIYEGSKLTAREIKTKALAIISHSRIDIDETLLVSRIINFPVLLDQSFTMPNIDDTEDLGPEKGVEIDLNSRVTVLNNAYIEPSLKVGDGSSLMINGNLETKGLVTFKTQDSKEIGTLIGEELNLRRTRIKVKGDLSMSQVLTNYESNLGTEIIVIGNTNIETF